MGFCLEDANHAEFLCGLFGVIAYLCDKLFMCPEPVTQSFSLGDFICDSSNVLRYTAETVSGEIDHYGSTRSLSTEPVWETIYNAVNTHNVTNLLKSVPDEAQARLHLEECEPKSELKMKRTHFICGLLGSFGFICEGLNCVEVATEGFRAGDFVCDLSSVLKFFALKAIGKDKDRLIELGLMLPKIPTEVVHARDYEYGPLTPMQAPSVDDVSTGQSTDQGQSIIPHTTTTTSTVENTPAAIRRQMVESYLSPTNY